MKDLSLGSRIFHTHGQKPKRALTVMGTYCKGGSSTVLVILPSRKKTLQQLTQKISGSVKVKRMCLEIETH